MQHLPTVQPRQLSVADLARVVPEAVVIGDTSVVVNGLQYDSRWLQAGELFAALVGSDLDGHDYVDDVLQRGAVALLVERQQPVAVPQLVVPNSRSALAQLAAAFMGNPSRELEVIGITGTDGKTTTGYILNHLLKTSGLNVGLIGTVGIAVGEGKTYDLGHQTTPESNLLQGYLREMVERNVSHAIVEATSHGLSMHRLDEVRFRYAGVTNMTTEHLEYHKTVENYWAAKGLLVERVAAEQGVVVLNADDPGAMSALPRATGATVVTISAAGQTADLRAANHSIRANGTSFTLIAGDNSFHVEMPLIGSFNIDNALIAIGLAQATGLQLTEIVAGLKTTGGVPGRMQSVDEGQPFSVVVDFAHTPDSLRKILGFLRTMTNGRLIVVSGSGGQRDAVKRPLQGRACTELADLAIFTNEDPRFEDPLAILRDIAAGAIGTEGENYLIIEDRTEAIATAFAAAVPGDLVLLAGKGHEKTIMFGAEARPWNEDAIARELLRRLQTD